MLPVSSFHPLDALPPLQRPYQLPSRVPKKDRHWAEWFHRALECYVIPTDLFGTPILRGELIRDSRSPIFRDEDELPANADLATGIRAETYLTSSFTIPRWMHHLSLSRISMPMSCRPAGMEPCPNSSFPV